MRVSTGRQGRSGLGLDAQRKAVDDFLNEGDGKVVNEFVEVESGKKSDRPVLAEAIKACRLYGATLVIAKIEFSAGLESVGGERLCCKFDYGCSSTATSRLQDARERYIAQHASGTRQVARPRPLKGRKRGATTRLVPGPSGKIF